MFFAEIIRRVELRVRSELVSLLCSFHSGNYEILLTALGFINSSDCPRTGISVLTYFTSIYFEREREGDKKKKQFSVYLVTAVDDKCVPGSIFTCCS